uniref:Reverse transcriptase n=1 Tax=Knipowitschia caucasica TaxID=637954 RepID=A0AAV2MPD5_KNICA
MEKTFSHRRLEIVEQKPRIAEVKDRWPALFTPNGVNDEFVRITTKPLVSKFLSQLDHFSEKLISIFKPKGGAKGLKIRRLLEQSEEDGGVPYLNWLKLFSKLACS